MSDAHAQWYYLKGSEQSGPVTLDHVRALVQSGQIDRSTLVWTQSMANWLPLGETELGRQIGGGPPPMVPASPGYGAAPAPAAYGAAPAAYGAAPAGYGAAPAGYGAGGAAYGAPAASPGFVDAIKICLRKYVTWAGRATRSEYWWFVLFYMIVLTAAIILDVMFLGGAVSTDPAAEGANFKVNFTVLTSIAQLALFLPILSVMVRRLHDIDKSGWWYWIILVPLVGGILLIVWLCKRGTPGPNRFG